MNGRDHLGITQDMERLMDAMYFDRIPPMCEKKL